MSFKKTGLLLLLPLAISACDSGQPTYSASNAASAPPPPAQAQPAAQPPPPPVAQAAAAPVPPPTAPARPQPATPGFDSASRFAQVPAGKMGPVAKIGVGTCDDYVERYRTCFNSTTIPREQKFPLRRALGGQVRQWKADTQAGRISQVAAACTEADKKARVEFAKVGCTTF